MWIVMQSTPGCFMPDCVMHHENIEDAIYASVELRNSILDERMHDISPDDLDVQRQYEYITFGDYGFAFPHYMTLGKVIEVYEDVLECA